MKMRWMNLQYGDGDGEILMHGKREREHMQ